MKKFLRKVFKFESGATRHAFPFGKIVVKIPRHTNIREGLKANLVERETYLHSESKKLLAPTYWVGLFGMFLVQKRVKILTTIQFQDSILCNGDLLIDMYRITADIRAENIGLEVNKERYVLVDFAMPPHSNPKRNRYGQQN